MCDFSRYKMKRRSICIPMRIELHLNNGIYILYLPPVKNLTSLQLSIFSQHKFRLNEFIMNFSS